MAYRRGLGDRLRELGRVEEALAQYEAASGLDPDDASVSEKRMEVLFDLGRIEEGLREALRGIDLLPSGYEKAYAHDRVGDRLRELGRVEEALAQYEAAVQLQPDSAWMQRDLINLLVQLGRVEEAIARAGSIENVAGQVAYRRGLGDRLRELGRVEEALAQYEAAVQLQPDSPAIQRHLADLQMFMGRTAEALRIFRSLIGKDSNCTADYGRALEIVGRHAEALSAYKAAVTQETNPYQQARMVQRLSEYHLRVGDSHAAVDEYVSALDGDSNDDLRLGLIALYQRLGRYSDALEEAGKLRDIGVASEQKGWIFLYGTRSLGSAIDCYRVAVRSSTADLRLEREVRLGEALAQAGRWSEAKEIFHRAIGTSQESRARFAWGNALSDEGRYVEALAQYRACPRRENDQIYVHCRHNAAWVLEKQFKYGEARGEWAQVLQLHEVVGRQHDLGVFDYMYDLSASETYAYMGVIASDLQKFDLGATYIQRSLEYDPNNLVALCASAVVFKEMRDRDHMERPDGYWRSHGAMRRAQEVLRERVSHAPGSAIAIKDQIAVAETLLTLGDNDAAEQWLNRVAPYAKNDITFEQNMGVLRASQQRFDEAASRFRRAIALEPENLRARSNLAECLLHLGDRAEAESCYKKNMALSTRNVETLIGLGETYAAMGDAGEDPEVNYTRAIDFFGRGMDASETRQGSKILGRSEKSALLYSRGYAYAKLFDGMDATPDNAYMHLALKDFKKSCDIDRERDKARLAAERIEERLKRMEADRIARKGGPLLIGVLAFAIFVLAQLCFFWGDPFPELQPAYHGTLTFGSLVFLIASLYLPSLLRLKLAGVELEKRPVEQIGTSMPLGISR
ncbi:tetratricopeptide repeat protein [Kocuria sp. NPDC057446]|uniref:tetratricopeptide repeat protein n=1 Tax=Kocuria sp. NPDC057446 TaxID=3346137 RepID=UPI0036831803